MAGEAGAARPVQSGSRGRRWVGRIFAILLGLVLGLVVVELVFRARDDDAYSHLNCFDADEELGVRLSPGCQTRVRVVTNPPVFVHVNAAGTRGPELGAAADDEIVVVGDSQVFGLGVEDDETFAAVLGELTHHPVINGGVPTHGPLEYTATARRFLEERHVHTVVWVVNMANDFFEHSRPDRERHGVWDHWAVRRETMPSSVTSFPGREWLYQRSHAFLALRRWMHQTDATIDAARDVGFPSEGTLRDLVQEGEDAEARHAEAATAHAAAITEHQAELSRLARQRVGADESVDQALLARDDLGVGDAHIGDDVYGWDVLYVASGHPGDILSIDDGGEDGRSVVVTASLLSQALRLRRSWVARALRSDPDGQVRAALEARDSAEHALDAELARRLDEAPVPSVLEPRLREIVDLCAAHDAELVVVGLPLDVLVSDAEFAKYGARPSDVSESRTLLADLVATAEGMGVRAIDVTDALRAAEPGAFLDGDLHLSAAGHAAVAAAIRDRLAGPVPIPRPGGGLPEGRTPVPEPDEFLHETESTVRGSTAAGCVTHLVHEWMRISCREAARNHPTGVTVVSGGHGEAMSVTTEEATTLTAPLFAGEDFVADFHYTDRTLRLTVHWPEGAEAPEASFGEPLPAALPTRTVSEADARLCACHREAIHQRTCADDEYGYPDLGACTPTCVELYGQAMPECMTQFATDCASMLRCARGDLSMRASCPDGSVSSLAAGTCHALCAPAAPGREEVPCATGTCTPWQGAHVCVP